MQSDFIKLVTKQTADSPDDAKQQRLISKAPPPPNHIKTASTFKQTTIGDLIKAKQNQDPITPNGYQQITMLYDYFTPHQAACFIAGLHPNFNGSDDGLEMANSVINGGIKSGRLPIDNDGQINADNLKDFLYKKGWLMTGFNDDSLSSDKPMTKIKEELIEAKSKILDLTAKLEQAELDSIILNSSGTLELVERLNIENKHLKDQQNKQAIDAQAQIADLEAQLSKANAALADTPANEEKLQSTNWQNMSEHIYPPELHLAMMIWQRIYWDNELKDSHITSHNGKYEVIANKINLNPKSTLGKRVGIIINNAFTKNKQSELAEQLQVINGIHMPKK